MTPMTHSRNFILCWLTLLLLFLTGCRQVERIEQQQDLPLKAWNRDLYNSEGVQVYASSAGAAREVAQKAEDAARSFLNKTGEQPRQILFIAISANDPIDQELVDAGIQGLSRISGKPVPDLHKSIQREAKRKGTQGIEGEEVVFNSMLGMIPGILAAPATRPANLWEDAVAIPTSSRISASIDEIILFFMEREELNTFQKVLLAPVIAIAKRYMAKILDSVQEAIILGVHAQGREGWTQEQVEQLIKETLEESGFDQLGEDLTNRTRNIRDSNSSKTTKNNLNGQ